MILRPSWLEVSCLRLRFFAVSFFISFITSMISLPLITCIFRLFIFFVSAKIPTYSPNFFPRIWHFCHVTLDPVSSRGLSSSPGLLCSIFFKMATVIPQIFDISFTHNKWTKNYFLWSVSLEKGQFGPLYNI